MRILSILLPLLLICCSTSDATAGSTAERVKARGFVRCGSVERPGLASDAGRAVAAAVLGSP